MSISNEYYFKTFTKGPLASLLQFIENILNHSSRKCCDYLTMAALKFTKSVGHVTIFISVTV